MLYDRHQCLSIDSQLHEQANSCLFGGEQLITGTLAGMCDNAAKTHGSNHLKHNARPSPKASRQTKNLWERRCDDSTCSRKRCVSQH
ncbi:hypothetical protein EMIT0P253_190040 [Pseudomonas sp. IT-P253]